MAGAGTKALVKSVGKAVIRDVAIGALADAGVETARQLVTGTKITNLEYDRIAEAGVYGGIAGGGSTLVGAGLEGLMKTRAVQSAVKKINLAASKGRDAIQNGFAKIAKENGKTAAEAVTELDESGFKMDLQRFASDEAYRSGSVPELQTYYHVTTDDNAKKIIETGQLKNGKWEAKVFAWSQQPTKKQASIAGISSDAKAVLKFKTNASFTKDVGNADCSAIKDIVLESSVGQRLPISITDIEIVGFKKEWWQFWKK